MARPPSPREHYDIEVNRVTTLIRTVEVDSRRGEAWKTEVLSHLRRARELLAQAPPTKDETATARRKPPGKTS